MGESRIFQIACIFFAIVAVASAKNAKSIVPFVSDPALLNTVVKSTNGFSEFVLTADNEDATLTVPEIIRKYGYICEIHEIETTDGYLLEVHRIPYGKDCPATAENKRVIWLQHGLMGDSSNWIITGPEQRGLGYELADTCEYDVWMGNFRGTTYSRNKHINDTIEFYWDFTFETIGMYDVPAFIEYAIEQTETESIYYVGHSMGTTTFFVCMSERPEYNEKVKLFIALAPVAIQEYTRSLLVRALLPFLDQLQEIVIGVPLGEMLPITWTEGLAKLLCPEGSPTQKVCGFLLGLVGGFNNDQMDWDALPILLGHSPAGSSAKVFLHYGQNIKDGKFQVFDEDRKDGIELRQYDLGKVNVPTVMFWGENDFLADKTDVMRTALALKGTLLDNIRINHDNFTHLDFIWALDQHKLVNEPIMTYMDYFAKYGTRPTEKPTEENGSVGIKTHYFLLLSLAVAATFKTFAL